MLYIMNYHNKYLKYKKKYLNLRKIIWSVAKKGTYTIKICFLLVSSDKPIKEILIDKIEFNIEGNPLNDYDSRILNKINKVLQDHSLTKIKEFHYIQEDGDIAYVNKELVEDTDLFDAIKYNTSFYVYYDY